MSDLEIFASVAARMSQAPNENSDRLDRLEGAQRQEANAKYLKRLGVPALFVDELYSEKLQASHQPLQFAEEFMGVDRRKVSILVLAGRFGIGKTLAAAACLKMGVELLPEIPEPRNDIVERWHTAAQVARRGNYSPHLDDMAKVPMLVVDDMGAEYADTKGSFITNVSNVVIERQTNYLPTILTTNMTAKEFRKHYEDAPRLFERIRQSGWYREHDGSVDIMRRRCEGRAGT